MKTNIFLLFVTILLSVAVGSLLKENATLRHITVATCPTPIVTAEQLEQAGYNLDKLVQHSFKQVGDEK